MKDKKSFVVFSGDLAKVLAAFILANGAVAMGDEVSMFFTFWGLHALTRTGPPVVKRHRSLPVAVSRQTRAPSEPSA